MVSMDGPSVVVFKTVIWFDLTVLDSIHPLLSWRNCFVRLGPVVNAWELLSIAGKSDVKNELGVGEIYCVAKWSQEWDMGALQT